MCLSNTFPAKTLCRLFAFLNLFLGLLSLYYWEILSSFIDKITLAPSWESLLSSNTEDIAQQCGNDYLKNVSPRQFGTIFKNSIHLYITACIIFSVKGFIQFFITCCNPVLARSLSITILGIDLFTCGLFLYGLHIFRSPQLCLLEYTDVFNYPGQQSQMTMLSLLSLAILKPPEFLSLLCFIREQSQLISLGETRSKGVRRSEAFRTPMCSRANSYVGCTMDYQRGGDFRKKHKRPTEQELQQINSSDDAIDGEEGEGCGDDRVRFDLARNHYRVIAVGNGQREFVEIDLNDNAEVPVPHSSGRKMGRGETSKGTHSQNSHIDGNDNIF